MITDEMLVSLRREVARRVSEKRFSHVLGVERCAARLASYILPEKETELRAAAILHDVTKELPYSEQIKMLEASGVYLTDEDRATEGILHSFTAPIIVSKDFDTFATDDVLAAVKNHTVGDENMSVFEKIIFISDYAEDTRTYESCVAVRKMLFENIEALSESERLNRLNQACLASIDGALEALKRCSRPINSRMYKTRNSLLKK